MKQNKYDEPEFFANYGNMRRSISGLDDAHRKVTGNKLSLP